MKNDVLKMVFLLSILLVQRALNAQIVYPPNYSFEDDTINYGVLPWQTSGYHDLNYSVNMIFASEGKYFFELASFRINNVYANSKLWIKFPMNERVRFLNFESMFKSQFENYKFRVKMMMTKFDSFYKRSYMICVLDSMMDTLCNFREYRRNWIRNKIDLKPYYLSNESPDSCYIEVSCDLNYKGFFDYIQYLYLDNFVLTGNVDDQLSIQSETNKDVLLYPNPANGSIHVDLSHFHEAVTMELIALDGRVVLSRNIDDTSVEWDVSSVSQGHYILKIETSDRQSIFKKIVIE